MSGKPGRSGTNHNKHKPWAEALRQVVFRDDKNGRRALLRIAEVCEAAALAGDMTAIKEIGDRLDGKPAQESSVTVTRVNANELSDDELAYIIRGGGGDDSEPAKDPPVTH